MNRSKTCIYHAHKARIVNACLHAIWGLYVSRGLWVAHFPAMHSRWAPGMDSCNISKAILCEWIMIMSTGSKSEKAEEQIVYSRSLCNPNKSVL